MTRRRFSGGERAALYLAADGKCAECGADLEPGFHADHVIPHSQGGATHVTNGQALCPECNLRKGNRMARSLLPWQQDALVSYETAAPSQGPPPRFLLAAFPGTGKTEAAAAILASTGRFGIILAYQDDMLTSWRATLHGRGICPAAKVSRDSVSTTCTTCETPVRAAVMTYQFAAANPAVLAVLYAKRGPCLLICDEVHHLRHERALGTPIAAVRPYIDAVLSLSATPFRTDEEPVPFVHTQGPWTRELAPLPEHCIVDYPYWKALLQKPPVGPVVTRAVFQRYDADVSWLERDDDPSTEVSAVLSKENDKDKARKARRHAVNARGDWMQRVLRAADGQLESVRRSDQRGGGLVICTNTDHAVDVADRLAQGRGAVTVYTQEYSTRDHRPGGGRRQCASCGSPFNLRMTAGRPCCPECGDTDWTRPGDESGDVLDDFRNSDAKWIITVRKVSEGVDIPRLRVLVYATVTRTPLFFKQALGRVIRIRRDLPSDVDQTAWVYIPDDPQMQMFARDVEDQIAEVEIAELDDDDDDSPPRPRTVGEPRSAGTQFIRADGQYSGAIAGGADHDPDLTALAAELGEPSYDALRILGKLREKGHLNLTGSPSASPTAHDTAGDPAKDLRARRDELNNAVKSWASFRLRQREFATFQDAARACYNEVGELFDVWGKSANVPIKQVEKATTHARERLRDLHHE